MIPILIDFLLITDYHWLIGDLSVISTGTISLVPYPLSSANSLNCYERCALTISLPLMIFHLSWSHLGTSPRINSRAPFLGTSATSWSCKICTLESHPPICYLELFIPIGTFYLCVFGFDHCLLLGTFLSISSMEPSRLSWATSRGSTLCSFRVDALLFIYFCRWWFTFSWNSSIAIVPKFSSSFRNLKGNQLTGTIPAKQLLNFTQLTALYSLNCIVLLRGDF